MSYYKQMYMVPKEIFVKMMSGFSKGQFSSLKELNVHQLNINDGKVNVKHDVKKDGSTRGSANIIPVKVSKPEAQGTPDLEYLDINTNQQPSKRGINNEEIIVDPNFSFQPNSFSSASTPLQRVQQDVPVASIPVAGIPLSPNVIVQAPPPQITPQISPRISYTSPLPQTTYIPTVSPQVNQVSMDASSPMKDDTLSESISNQPPIQPVFITSPTKKRTPTNKILNKSYLDQVKLTPRIKTPRGDLGKELQLMATRLKSKRLENMFNNHLKKLTATETEKSPDKSTKETQASFLDTPTPKKKKPIRKTKKTKKTQASFEDTPSPRKKAEALREALKAAVATQASFEDTPTPKKRAGPLRAAAARKVLLSSGKTEKRVIALNKKLRRDLDNFSARKTRSKTRAQTVKATPISAAKFYGSSTKAPAASTPKTIHGFKNMWLDEDMTPVRTLKKQGKQ